MERLRTVATRLIILFALVAAPTSAWAIEQIRTEPQFFFNNGYASYPEVYHASPEEALEYARPFVETCGGGACKTLINFRPRPVTDVWANQRLNGIAYHHIADIRFCPTSGGGSCWVNPESFIIQTIMVCPQEPIPMSGYQTNSDPIFREYICLGSLPEVEPDKDCNAIGHWIHPATCQKLLIETDYASESGPLEFRRTYRSDKGSFTSVADAFWLDSRTDSIRCLEGRYAQYTFCLEYIETLTDRFTLLEPDGRRIIFHGPATSMTARADVNDRAIQQVNGSGAIESTVTRGDGRVQTFNEQGLLVSTVFRGGHTIVYQYSDGTTSPSVAPKPGLLIRMTDDAGRALSFTYNTAGRMVTMTDPSGGVFQYAYDAAGNTTSVTYPDTRSRQYLYNEPANINNGTACPGNTIGLPKALTGVIDESGTRYATYKYDCQSRAISTELNGGVDHYTFNPVSSPYQTTITDPLGSSRVYTFQGVQGVWRNTSISQPCPNDGCPKSMVYDANGNVSKRTDFNNYETRYTYDLARNLETSRTEAYGTPRARTITTQWHSTFRLPTQIDEPGRRTTFTHDGSGNVLTKTVLDTSTSTSRTWTYTYNSRGQILTANGPRTDVLDVATYTYYSCTTGYQCGHVETITNALGHVTTYDTYNAHGQPLTITDPNGVVTTLTYDARQRLTSRTVGTEQTIFDYWPAGLLKKVTLPDGSFLQYTYDAAHRLTQIADSEGNRIVYTLDAMGNRTAENLYDPSNALTQTRTRVFNTLNRLWKEIGAAGTAAVTTTFGYDSNGNQTGSNAPLSRNTVQAYDELNRLKQVTDPLAGVTQYGYNALDQLISVTDPRSKVTSYTYNALGDLTQQVSPDTGTTTSTYDSGGNLASSTDARSKTGTYAYDALNRVTSVTYPDQTITYTYDSGTNQKGRLTQVSDASGSTSWTYDTHGRVLSRQQSMGISKTLGYAYDSAGRLQTLALPSGNTITYGYTDGKVTSLTLNGSTTLLSSVLYQPFGSTRGWTWGNSTLAIREYDTDGEVTDIDSAGLKTYSYDDAFRITGITDGAHSSLSQSYGYDLLDRLTSATGTSLDQGWTYDANGNRLTQTGSAASTHTVSSTSNRLSNVSGALSRSYSYDSSGNTTSDGAATFTYNDAGRMISATKASVTTTYALNALGQRVKKITSGSSRYFVYDEAGHQLGEYDNSGNLLQETIWLGDTPVATLKPNGSGVDVFYVHTDHLNTPRRISRPSDNVIVWRWDSDPFGTTVANEDPDGDSNLFGYNLRFPGQYYDAETRLHYNYYRDYDPQTGGYTRSDPIGLAGGINTYAYAGGNPSFNVDPLGLFFTSVDAACAIDPQFCAEMMGQMAQNLGDLSGDQCLAQEARDVSRGLEQAAAIASIASVAVLLRRAIVPWSNKAVRDAAKALERGAKEVQVASRSQAEELFLGRYQGSGYRNTTGMSPREVKDFYGGKSGTYHWDIGQAGYPHDMSHLQIHTPEGDIIRIMFRE
jgi:RHS repeat-associated protein